MTDKSFIFNKHLLICYVPFRNGLTGLFLPSFNLCTLVYADGTLVTARDQVNAGILESEFCLHVHASNASVNRHKLEIIPLNGIDMRERKREKETVVVFITNKLLNYTFIITFVEQLAFSKQIRSVPCCHG
jgi:hypothetical protein